MLSHDNLTEHGPSVFRDAQFVSWAKRVNEYGEVDGLLNEDGDPLYPFFWDLVAADEAQDFMEIDLVLFAKMSASLRSLFLCADPAQVGLFLVQRFILCFDRIINSRCFRALKLGCG